MARKKNTKAPAEEPTLIIKSTYNIMCAEGYSFDVESAGDVQTLHVYCDYFGPQESVPEEENASFTFTYSEGLIVKQFNCELIITIPENKDFINKEYILTCTHKCDSSLFIRIYFEQKAAWHEIKMSGDYLTEIKEDIVWPTEEPVAKSYLVGYKIELLEDPKIGGVDTPETINIIIAVTGGSEKLRLKGVYEVLNDDVEIPTDEPDIKYLDFDNGFQYEITEKEFPTSEPNTTYYNLKITNYGIPFVKNNRHYEMIFAHKEKLRAEQTTVNPNDKYEEIDNPDYYTDKTAIEKTLKIFYVATRTSQSVDDITIEPNKVTFENYGGTQYLTYVPKKDVDFVLEQNNSVELLSLEKTSLGLALTCHPNPYYQEEGEELYGSIMVNGREKVHIDIKPFENYQVKCLKEIDYGLSVFPETDKYTVISVGGDAGISVFRNIVYPNSTTVKEQIVFPYYFKVENPEYEEGEEQYVYYYLSLDYEEGVAVVDAYSKSYTITLNKISDNQSHTYSLIDRLWLIFENDRASADMTLGFNVVPEIQPTYSPGEGGSIPDYLVYTWDDPNRKCAYKLKEAAQGTHYITEKEYGELDAETQANYEATDDKVVLFEEYTASSLIGDENLVQFEFDSEPSMSQFSFSIPSTWLGIELAGSKALLYCRESNPFGDRYGYIMITEVYTGDTKNVLVMQPGRQDMSTEEPTEEPTERPTERPTEAPTAEPTETPI